MEDEVELPTKMLHGPVHQGFEVRHGSGIRGDHDGAALLREAVDLAQADRNGRVCQNDLRAFGDGKFRHLPGDGLIVQCAEYQTFAAF